MDKIKGEKINIPKEFSLKNYSRLKDYDHKDYALLLRVRAFFFADFYSPVQYKRWIKEIIHEPLSIPDMDYLYPASPVRDYNNFELCRDVKSIYEDGTLPEFSSEGTKLSNFDNKAVHDTSTFGGASRKVITIDLRNPYKILMDEFSKYIQQTNNSHHYQTISTPTTAKKAEQISNKWLPLLDLFFYRKFVNEKLKLREIFELVFEGDSGDSCDKGKKQLERAKIFIKRPINITYLGMLED